MQFPPRRPIPKIPTANKEENLDCEKEKLTQSEIQTEKKDFGKSRDMLFGVLGGLALILAIVCFVLMFVL